MANRRLVKRIFSALSAVTVAAGTAAGSAGTACAAGPDAAEEGAVFNIYCYNEEFRARLADHHPAYITIDDATGRIGNVTIRWTMIPTDGEAYQQTLTNLLTENETLPADTRVDLFLADGSFLGLFADAAQEVTVPVEELGITEEELEEQYGYTKEAASDPEGVLRGLTWQCTPGVMIYNRKIAKDTWGTDDPEEIQKHFTDWEAYRKAADELLEKGFLITASASDTFRPYAGNMAGRWLGGDGNVVIPENVGRWIRDSKRLVDAGETTTASMWSSDWNAALMPSGNVFCCFGPEWMIRYGLGQDLSGSVAAQGGWAVCRGPESFFWGGTWLFTARGTDNAALAADIMRTMTADQEVLAEIRLTDGDFVNSRAVMESTEVTFPASSDVLGGQDPTETLTEAAESIENVLSGRRDTECREALQAVAREYFEGGIKTYEELAEAFASAVSG